MAGPTVLGVERVNNPHVLSIYDELRQQPGIRFTGCVLEPLPPWRVEIGWPELDEDAPYLQPFRRAEDRARYLELAANADVAIWPSLKFPASLRLISKRSRQGKPTAIWAERFIQKRRRPWYLRLMLRAAVRTLNSRHVHLMTMGTGAAEDYRQYGASRWTVWQFGYAVEPVLKLDHDLRPAPGGVLRIVFVGALRMIKAVDVLLRALGTPALAAEPWRLTLVGEGKRRGELEALTEELGIAGKVVFAGAVPRGRIAGVYADADVLVLPSRTDGWGAVVNEAMEHGLAVITSDAVGCAAMLIAHGTNGFVFPRENVSALAKCFQRLLHEPELCAAMRRASRERIAQFRPRVAAERAAKLFRGLTGHEPLPRFDSGWCMPLS